MHDCWQATIWENRSKASFLLLVYALSDICSEIEEASKNCQNELIWGANIKKLIWGVANLYSDKWSNPKYFFIHLGYSFNSILLFNTLPIIGGIPPPGRGIVGKNPYAHKKVANIQIKHSWTKWYQLLGYQFFLCHTKTPWSLKHIFQIECC